MDARPHRGGGGYHGGGGYRGGRSGYHHHGGGGYREGGHRGRDYHSDARDYSDGHMHKDFRRDGGRSLKRQRCDEREDIENRLNSLLIRIGDKSQSTHTLESNLQGLADALEGDVTNHRTQILQMLFQCVMQLSLKTPVYGTLVGLMNVKNTDFGNEVVLRTATELEKAYLQSDVKAIKLLTRFVGELVNACVIHPVAIFSVYDQLQPLVTAAIDEEKDERTRAEARQRADVFAYIVLATLPFVAPELAAKTPDELGRLLDTLALHFSRRRSQTALSVLAVNEKDEVVDYLDKTWAQLLQLRDEGWQALSVLKPSSALSSILTQATRHEFPVSAWSAGPSVKYEGPHLVFRLFDESKTGVKDTIDRFLLEEHIVDLIHFFRSDHKTCAKLLLTALPTRANPEYLVVETILAQLFLLPKSPFRPICYNVLLADLCRMTLTVPPILAQAVEVLFERLETMDIECVDRFAEWFAYHLSSFDYGWEWNKWESILSLDAEKPQVLFLKDVLDRCVRLSYWERVSRSIPESFGALMPPKPAPATTTPGTVEEQNDCGAMVKRMREKQTSDQIFQWLREIQGTHDAKLAMVLHALLLLGSKSFSHLLNALDRYHELARAVINNEARRVQAINAIAQFWNLSKFNLIIALDKFMTYRVIDSLAIIQWVFSPAMLPEFVHGYVWEILRNAIDKTIGRSQILETELSACNRALVDKGITDMEGSDAVKFRQTRDALELVRREHKQLFFGVFQRFCMVLSNHLATCEARGANPLDSWYRSAAGHMKEMGRRYNRDMEGLLDSLEETLQTADLLDQRVIQQFKLVAQCRYH
eukprot:TRINITY_DN5951_c0_g1_i1.p1 TRINITY_DN5951_c0_g1~~TRINITY_DN5951_c0_g1_i1.p1  ORF type:complete len:819 (-),score=70.52 TRINITY_DN5951_c0_g1_i1:395-2851(-)